MRLTTVILIASLIQVSAATFGQRITLNKSNVPLFSVLKEIRKQSGYDFYYDANTISQDQRVSVAVSNATIEETLVSALNGLDLVYQIDGRTVSIKKKEEPTFLDRLARRWANIDVRGKVYGENDQVLAGASVRVKGTKLATTTDARGEFYLGSVDENAVLEVSFIGYVTREMKVAKDMGVIRLEMTNNDLSEIAVVSTGYQSIPKERATGSFSKIDNSTFNRQVATSVIAKLKGIAPSIYFDERSASGNTNINVRGQSTIYGNAKPLIVIDNFPFDGDLNNINPNDVQDITILKDAAAASIWGVRAGNGVIVITTKKGEYNQQPKFNLNSSVNIGSAPDLFYQLRMSTSDFIDVEQFLFSKGFYDATISNTFFAPVYSPVVDILNQQKKGQLSEQQAISQINALRTYDLRNDLEKFFYQTPVSQQYALSASGGTQKHIYFLSVGLDKNTLSTVKNDFSRLSISGNQTFKPIKGLEITTGVFINRNRSNTNNSLRYITSGMGSGKAMYPYARLADENGNHLPVYKDYTNTFKTNALNAGYLDWTLVPLDELDLQENTVKTNSTRLTAGIAYTFIKGLSADLKIQYEGQNTAARYYNDQNSYYVRDLVNRFTPGFVTPLARKIPFGGILEQNNSELSSINGRAQINYNNVWGDHELHSIAGFDVREIKNDGSNSLFYGYDKTLGTSTAVDYVSSVYTYPSFSQQTVPGGDYVTGTVDRFRSYFANASYTYVKKYTISGSARIDQSNLFGVNANQRAVPLWSAGLKWDISKEAFYLSSQLPQLSIRTSYGYNGNLDNTLTAYTTAKLGNSDSFQTPAAQLLNPPNANLRWEKTGQWNIGLDFSTKNNRISGSFEYYAKNGKDLIGLGLIDPTTGFKSYKGNVANMKGKGIDIELTTVNLDAAFRWTTNYLFSYTMDRVKDYKLTPSYALFFVDGSLERTPTYIQPVSDRPLYGIYSTPWAGLDPATGVSRGYLNGLPSTDFSAIQAALSLNLPHNLIYNGPALAPYFGYIRNTFGYKGFELSFNVGYRFGYYFRRNSINYDLLFNSYTSHSDYSKRWQKSGDEQFTNVPAIVYPLNAASSSYYTNSEILVERGDNIRLQDATFSYTLSAEKFKWFPFKTLKAYSYANNIGILWRSNKNGIDPDYPVTKPVRSIALGLTCTF